jgi:hypothetical protein
MAQAAGQERGMTEADGFYLDRQGQRALIATLKEIPDLIEDLAVTQCKQGHVSAAP